MPKYLKMNTQKKNSWLIGCEKTDLLDFAKLLSKQLGQFMFLISVCENFHCCTSLPTFNIFTNLMGMKWECMASYYLHYITNWAESLFRVFIGHLWFFFCSYPLPIFLFSFSYWFEELFKYFWRVIIYCLYGLQISVPSLWLIF